MLKAGTMVLPWVFSQESWDIPFKTYGVDMLSDLNEDGVVNFIDLSIFVQQWVMTYASAGEVSGP